ADVFVFPSRREGMPNTVLEALGCGVPSVLTPFIGLPEEFGRPGTEYLLSERTAEGLATAVTRILESPALRDELSAAGRRWVEESLGVETSLDRYAALYRELARKAAAR